MPMGFPPAPGVDLRRRREVIPAENDDLHVSSTYGEGSDFYFSIPQKIIDPMPSVSVNEPEKVFALGLFSRKYLARRFFIDTSRMGVYSAAHAMGLDFIPVGEEEYDFAMRPEALEMPEMKSFLRLLTGGEFRAQLEKLGGYTFNRTGEVRTIGTDKE